MKIAPPSPLKNEVFSLIHGIKIFKKFNESPQGNNRDFTVSQKFKHVWTTRLSSSKDFTQAKKDYCIKKKSPFKKKKKVSHEKGTLANKARFSSTRKTVCGSVPGVFGYYDESS